MFEKKAVLVKTVFTYYIYYIHNHTQAMKEDSMESQIPDGIPVLKKIHFNAIHKKVVWPNPILKSLNSVTDAYIINLI